MAYKVARRSLCGVALFLLIFRQHMLQFLNVQFCGTAGLCLGVGDPADLHAFRRIQRHRNNVAAVQVGTDHTAANGVAVDSAEQVEQCRTVADANTLFVRHCAEQFLCKVKGVVDTLFKAQERIWLQICRSDGTAFCQRVSRSQKDVWKKILKSIPHKERLATLHAICLQIFRHISQKCS